MFKKLIEKYLQWKHRGGYLKELQDDRDFVQSSIFSALKGSYTPKFQEVDNLAGIQMRNQKNLNTCVCEGGAEQKEKDEGTVLWARWMAAYLRSKGQMTDRGTSLSYFQKALVDVGIPDKTYDESEYNLSWEQFSNPNILTTENLQNASKHKSASYYKTYDLNKILEELDNGKIGHTGGNWYSGYNKPDQHGIITPYNGYLVGGHCTAIGGHILNYHGFKVAKVRNHYSERYGVDGCFYVKFEDIAKVFDAGVYFNTDMPKDVLSFLSAFQGKLVKELNGPKIYLIQDSKKWHFVDEQILNMKGFILSEAIEDKENILPSIEYGSEIDISWVSPQEKELAKDRVRALVDKNLLEGYKKYFPELFNS